MGPRPRKHRNGDRVTRDNDLVDAIAELMDVIRDLCRFATVFRMDGPDSWAETLIEQCAELLAYRARLLSGSREGTRASHPTSETNAVTALRGIKWTN